MTVSALNTARLLFFSCHSDYWFTLGAVARFVLSSNERPREIPLSSSQYRVFYLFLFFFCRLNRRSVPVPRSETSKDFFFRPPHNDQCWGAGSTSVSYSKQCTLSVVGTFDERLLIHEFSRLYNRCFSSSGFLTASIIKLRRIQNCCCNERRRELTRNKKVQTKGGKIIMKQTRNEFSKLCS